MWEWGGHVTNMVGGAPQQINTRACGHSSQENDQDQAEQPCEERGRAEPRCRVEKDESRVRAEQYSKAAEGRCQAEQNKLSKDEPRCRAEIDDNAGRAEQPPMTEDQAEHQEVSITITGAETRTVSIIPTNISSAVPVVRQCHTITWPVVRYVDLPVNIKNGPLLTPNIHLENYKKQEEIK